MWPLPVTSMPTLRLAEPRAWRGDVPGAEQILRARADVGDQSAAERLALTARLGDGLVQQASGGMRTGPGSVIGVRSRVCGGRRGSRVGDLVGKQGVNLGGLGGGVAEAAPHDLDGDAAVETGREQCSDRAEYLSLDGARGGYSPGW